MLKLNDKEVANLLLNKPNENVEVVNLTFKEPNNDMEVVIVTLNEPHYEQNCGQIGTIKLGQKTYKLYNDEDKGLVIYINNKQQSICSYVDSVDDNLINEEILYFLFGKLGNERIIIAEHR